MIGTAKLYILMSNWMTMIFIQGHIFMRNQKLYLDGIQYVATNCWFVEAHAKVTFHKYCSRERTLLM